LKVCKWDVCEKEPHCFSCGSGQRIASQSEAELLQSNIPFALAILAGLYMIESKKDDDLKYKYQLMRLLLQDQMKAKELKREYISCIAFQHF